MLAPQGKLCVFCNTNTNATLLQHVRTNVIDRGRVFSTCAGEKRRSRVASVLPALGGRGMETHHTMSDSTYDGYRWRLVKKTYAFLRQAEQDQRPFTLQELQRETGYSLETIRAYQTKLWRTFLAKHPSGGWLCQGLCPWEAFAKLHQQKRSPELMPFSPPMSEEAARPQDAGEPPHPGVARHVLAGWLAALLRRIRG
jgi:hypothetical protein